MQCASFTIHHFSNLHLEEHCTENSAVKWRYPHYDDFIAIFFHAWFSVCSIKGWRSDYRMRYSNPTLHFIHRSFIIINLRSLLCSLLWQFQLILCHHLLMGIIEGKPKNADWRSKAKKRRQRLNQSDRTFLQIFLSIEVWTKRLCCLRHFPFLDLSIDSCFIRIRERRQGSKRRVATKDPARCLQETFFMSETYMYSTIFLIFNNNKFLVLSTKTVREGVRFL